MTSGTCRGRVGELRGRVGELRGRVGELRGRVGEALCAPDVDFRGERELGNDDDDIAFCTPLAEKMSYRPRHPRARKPWIT
jgi:hypothetical protein